MASIFPCGTPSGRRMRRPAHTHGSIGAQEIDCTDAGRAPKPGGADGPGAGSGWGPRGGKLVGGSW